MIWLIVLGSTQPSSAAPQSVLTFHYDAYRTGWNPHETTLTPKNVAGPRFRLIGEILLDEQVDAQPLLVPGVSIKGHAYDVLYVATENKTVYAIDTANGRILLTANLGPPVPQSSLPGLCSNNSGVVGVNSTPVIDPARSTLYVMDYGYFEGKTAWYLHALDLSTLGDKQGSPIVVKASAALVGGTPYRFNAAVSRQRAALLEANGNIYAGFASFCDIPANTSRGFVLGWQARSLTPLPANRLNDRLAHSASDFYLSTVWMSGNGIAADGEGQVYFITGNSDPSGTSYSPVANLSESVVKVTPDLARVDSFFTPSDPIWGERLLEKWDGDFGSGGIMLLPRQPSVSAGLAVAAGKAGQMYLLDTGNLGGYDKSGINKVLGTYTIGPCWCGEAYFTGPDGTGRIVSSGGGQIMVWKVKASPRPALVRESLSQYLPASAQDGGFFTSVSSNGRQNPIVWAVGRPVSKRDDNIVLYAYDPVAAVGVKNPPWLFSAPAGTWPHLTANANIVPVVANGRVYVASYKQLDIFGLAGGSAASREQAARLAPPEPPAALPLPAGRHEVYGTIETIGNGTLTLMTRTGATIAVAVREAIDSDQSVDLEVGGTVRVDGAYDDRRLLHAVSIIKAKPSARGWPADR